MNTHHLSMFIKVVYVYLYFYSVHCKIHESSEEDAYYEYNDGKNSSENTVISKEHQCNETDLEDGILNSTIETSVCKYQEINEPEEAAEYIDTLEKYPYAASIQRQGSHYANGALVDKRWVLTCAGEFYNVRESIRLFRVRLGSVDCKRGGKVFPIKAIQIHPLFVRGHPSYDLALLRLAVPVLMTFVMHPIVLSTVDGNVISAKFMTTYWPRIVVKGKVLPSSAKERVRFTNMRVSAQELIPSAPCAKMVKELGNSSHCLKPLVTYHSPCSPDLGAPLIANNSLWGITSGWLSPNCTSEPGPTVFTRITSAVVRAWIDSQISSTTIPPMTNSLALPA